MENMTTGGADGIEFNIGFAHNAPHRGNLSRWSEMEKRHFAIELGVNNIYVWDNWWWTNTKHTDYYLTVDGQMYGCDSMPYKLHVQREASDWPQCKLDLEHRFSTY